MIDTAWTIITRLQTAPKSQSFDTQNTLHCHMTNKSMECQYFTFDVKAYNHTHNKTMVVIIFLYYQKDPRKNKQYI